MENTKHHHFFRNIPALLILAFIQYSFPAIGQETVLSWGGDAIGESGSISYSLGQVADEHSSGEGGYCNEGVQQPFISDSSTAYVEVTSNPDFSIYPNPFRQEATLNANTILESELQFSIMDLTGRIQTTGIINTLPQSIHIPSWPDGMYIMILRKNQIFIDAIKLIKAE